MDMDLLQWKCAFLFPFIFVGINYVFVIFISSLSLSLWIFVGPSDFAYLLCAFSFVLRTVLLDVCTHLQLFRLEFQGAFSEARGGLLCTLLLNLRHHALFGPAMYLPICKVYRQYRLLTNFCKGQPSQWLKIR